MRLLKHGAPPFASELLLGRANSTRKDGRDRIRTNLKHLFCLRVSLVLKYAHGKD